MSRAVKRILSIVIMMSIVSLSLSSYATEDSSRQTTGTGLSSVSQGIGVTSVSPGISENKISKGIPGQIKNLLGQELADFMRTLTEEDLVIAIDSLTEKQIASLEQILTENEKNTFKALYEQYLKNIEEIANNDFESEIANIGSASNVSSFKKLKQLYLSAESNRQNGLQKLFCPPEPEPLTLTKTASVANETERTYTIGLSAVLNKDVLVSAQCDIILLLDKSKSMTENHITFKLITSEPVTDGSKIYYYKVKNEYKKLEYDDEKHWHYDSKNKNLLPINNGEYQFYEGVIDRLTALTECAKSFVSNVAEKSPESRIAVVSFSGEAKTEVNLSTVTINGAVNTAITDAINKKETYDFTSHDFAMEKAIEIFDADGNKFEPRKKIVVMITDGEPHRHDTSDEDIDEKIIKKAAKSYAKTLKDSDYNATIYSIAIGIKKKEFKNFLKEISGANGGTGTYAFNTGSINELNQAFDGIAAQMQVKVQNVVIKDYISPNFEIVKPLPSGAKDYTDSNGTYIEWKHELTTITPFGSSFVIKAKSDFFGGNNIPTNIEEFTALYNSGTLVDKFPLPKVNVPIKAFSVTPKSETFYVAEEFTLLSVQQAMFTAPGLSSGEFIYTWKNGSATIPKADIKNEITALNNGEYTFEVKYEPEEADKDSVGTPVTEVTQSGLYKTAVLKPTVTTDDISTFAGDSVNLNTGITNVKWDDVPAGFTMPTQSLPTLTYKFYDKGSEITADYVTLNEKIVTVKSYVGSLSLDDSNCVTYAAPNANSFKINVLYGTVTAAKAIDINHEPHGDPIFLFKLERYDGTQLKQTWYDYVCFKDGSITPQSVTFDKLPKGEYKLTELKTIRYKLDNITAITGGTESNGAVTFSIGLNNPNGAATFNNIKNNNSLFTHTDVLQNKFTIRSSPPTL